MDIALFSQEGLVMSLRYIHFLAGVIWIGNSMSSAILFMLRRTR